MKTINFHRLEFHINSSMILYLFEADMNKRYSLLTRITKSMIRTFYNKRDVFIDMIKGN